MTDFYTVITAKGAADLVEAQVNATTVTLTEIALGDGNGAYAEPDGTETALVNEVHRVAIQSITQDVDNPNWMIVEAVIPPTEGGWTVREIGVFDSDGDMFAIGKYPATYKPIIAEGFGSDLVIRVILEVGSAASVILMVDPSQVLATREWVGLNFIGLPFATEAETIAGAIDDQAVHPAGVVAAIRTLAPTIVGNLALNVSTAGVAVPADPLAGDAFDTIVSAMDWLNGYNISASASVTINVAAGTYAHAAPILGHPNGSRIEIVGAALVGAFPVYADYTMSGDGTVDHATDAPANDAMLRAKFGVIIDVTGARAVECDGAGISSLTNILFVGDFSANDGIYLRDGGFLEGKIALHRFGGSGVYANSGGKIRSNSGEIAASNCGGYAAYGNDSCVLTIPSVVGSGNDSGGVFVNGESRAELGADPQLNYNKGPGLATGAGSSAFCSGGWSRWNRDEGVKVNAKSFVSCGGIIANLNGAANNFLANNGSHIEAAGATGTNLASPPINTYQMNSNSFISA